MNDISISVERSNFTWRLLRLLVMQILVQKENEQDLAHMFQNKHYASC